MATTKSYTDIEQSKKLAEILSLESADMYYYTINGYSEWYKTPNVLESIDDLDMDGNSIPCWSLAALLGVIPKHFKYYNVLSIDIKEDYTSIWYDEVAYNVNNDLPYIIKDNPVDACYEIIICLHELKML